MTLLGVNGNEIIIDLGDSKDAPYSIRIVAHPYTFGYIEGVEQMEGKRMGITFERDRTIPIGEVWILDESGRTLDVFDL